MAEIKTVTIDELCQMNDQEGLILQGCGGDLQEWVDGINELLTQGAGLGGSVVHQILLQGHQSVGMAAVDDLLAL